MAHSFRQPHPLERGHRVSNFFRVLLVWECGCVAPSALSDRTALDARMSDAFGANLDCDLRSQLHNVYHKALDEIGHTDGFLSRAAVEASRRGGRRKARPRSPRGVVATPVGGKERTTLHLETPPRVGGQFPGHAADPEHQRLAAKARTLKAFEHVCGGDGSAYHMLQNR